MRPRVFPAEDACVVRDRDARGRASMRPRVFPAEDMSVTFARAAWHPRFNEAAGIPRGRPTVTTEWCPTVTTASMRPRVFPAEDAVGMRRKANGKGLQ